MKKLLFFFIALLFTVSSCRDDIVVKNTPGNVFLAFWKTMNEGYVYFEEKKINWDSIYTVYYPRALLAKDDDELFGIMSEIIPQFKDSHLSLSKNTTKGVGYMPDAYSYYLFPKMYQYGFYLQASCSYKSYYMAYQHKTKSYVYIKFEGLNYEYNDSIIVASLKALDFKNGLIVDMRNYAGGSSEKIFEMASMFYSGEKTIFFKTSKSTRRNDFSIPIPIKYKGRGIVSSEVPVIVLTGIVCYSAGNVIAYILHDLPNCTSVGKPTGGGGSPVKWKYLPNGWVLSYPFSKCYSSTGANMEYSLKPDVYVNYDSSKDTTDTHLRKALSILDSINSIKK